MLTHYVENTNGTKQGGDLLLVNKLRIVPWGTERMTRQGTRGIGMLLYQHFLKENKMRRKNFAMAWIDYKKACNMAPQSWIIDGLKLYKVSDEIIKFVEKTMKNWKVELTAERKSFVEVKIQKGIFQGDALLSSLFVIAIMPQ